MLQQTVLPGHLPYNTKYVVVSVGRWRSMNDVVMGGRSSGSMSVPTQTREKYLLPILVSPTRNPGASIFLTKIWQRKLLHIGHVPQHLCSNFVHIFERMNSPHVQRFRGGLVFKAHRLLYHSTLGLRVTKKKKKRSTRTIPGAASVAC